MGGHRSLNLLGMMSWENFMALRFMMMSRSMSSILFVVRGMMKRSIARWVR